jgi:FRG domain
MFIKEAKDWEDFERQIQGVRDAEILTGRSAEFLFRGLSDSTCELTTTLERAGKKGIRISDYYQLIFRLKPQIESLFGTTWEIAPPPEVERLLRDYNAWALDRFPEPAAYSYMIHLRHHGFPSPLLDWTRSPYIAAFFAFRSSSKPADGKVSIYAFSESPKDSEVTGSGKPWIRRFGPYVRTHRRHFLQQCEYTMCGILESEWHFAKHEAWFARGDPHQDFLWKFDIPWGERLKVLKLLDDYNLNAFSLFESEECLMDTLALREMQFKAEVLSPNQVAP